LPRSFAFGLAAASLFPAIILGIFDKKMNKEGAIAGMIIGLLDAFLYAEIQIWTFDGGKDAVAGLKESWWFGFRLKVLEL
jgi:cation/acetate symporter